MEETRKLVVVVFYNEYLHKTNTTSECCIPSNE